MALIFQEMYESHFEWLLFLINSNAGYAAMYEAAQNGSDFVQILYAGFVALIMFARNSFHKYLPEIAFTNVCPKIRMCTQDCTAFRSKI